ncbi:hypothetical protein MXAN_3696 [Myxococcus xanthus DK 1622]|uniref:Uncharacterized protein n=1 Tax=Myxococcus xanthus (strain DK1622) TaxID=246197 RepID=Q1D640_MYXXD|nr:hypothetical protein MXAN_3696 [Myxococcus xanthus DK 1622]
MGMLIVHAWGFAVCRPCLCCSSRTGLRGALVAGGRERWRSGEGGRPVDMKTKKDLAVDFINTIRTMEPSALNALIVKEAGEELAQFFLNYSANLISKDPSRVLENTSSLMLMGYLIRTYEEKNTQSTQGTFQSYAFA